MDPHEGRRHDIGDTNLKRRCGHRLVDHANAPSRPLLRHFNRCAQWNTNRRFLGHNYTVTATNAGGSATATLTIQVNDIAPSSITYSPSTLSLTKDSTMTTVYPNFKRRGSR